MAAPEGRHQCRRPERHRPYHPEGRAGQRSVHRGADRKLGQLHPEPRALYARICRRGIRRAAGPAARGGPDLWQSIARHAVVGHGHHPASDRRRRRAGYGQSFADHRPCRQTRHRIHPAARPVQRAGLFGHAGPAQQPARLPRHQESRTSREVPEGLGRADA